MLHNGKSLEGWAYLFGNCVKEMFMSVVTDISEIGLTCNTVLTERSTPALQDTVTRSLYLDLLAVVTRMGLASIVVYM